MAVAERAHDAQMTIVEMRDIIEKAKHHILDLQRRERDLENVFEMVRSALLDEVAPPVDRIQTALRFLAMEHVL